VKPGAALSLQFHLHRLEHWVVVSGTARVTVDDTVRLVVENESVYFPLGAKHRMENPGKVPMVLIEVQTGSYLGEDDIIRYEDIYSRGQGTKGRTVSLWNEKGPGIAAGALSLRSDGDHASASSPFFSAISAPVS
jgi:uncharacterized cupin superfamily protein